MFFLKLTHVCLILQVKVRQPKEVVPGKEVSTKTRRLHLLRVLTQGTEPSCLSTIWSFILRSEVRIKIEISACIPLKDRFQ